MDDAYFDINTENRTGLSKQTLEYEVQSLLFGQALEKAATTENAT